MRKKYRIKTTLDTSMGIGRTADCPVYIVQVRAWWGMWVNVKVFYDPYDPDYGRREAEELLDKLDER